MLSLTVILLTACSQKVEYVYAECPYIEPLELNITTNAEGGLSPKEAYKAITALQYCGKEMRELKAFVLKRRRKRESK